MFERIHAEIIKKGQNVFAKFSKEISLLKIDNNEGDIILNIPLQDVSKERKEQLWDEISELSDPYHVEMSTSGSSLSAPSTQLNIYSNDIYPESKAFIKTFLMMAEELVAKKFNTNGSISLFWESAKKIAQLMDNKDIPKELKSVQDVMEAVEVARTFTK